MEIWVLHKKVRFVQNYQTGDLTEVAFPSLITLRQQSGSDRRKDLYSIKSTGYDLLSKSYTILNHNFLWTKKEEKKAINNKSNQHKKTAFNIIQETQWKPSPPQKENEKTKQIANFNMPHCSLGRFSFTESHLFYQLQQ